MSEQYSPKSGILISGSECGGGSQPELYSPSDFSYVNQNLRKRKQPDFESTMKTEFGSFKEEIMSFLKNFAQTQKEDTAQLRQDLKQIGEDIQNLKLSNQILSQNFESLSTEISKMKAENCETKESLNNMQKDIDLLKNNTPTNPDSQFQNTPFATHEDLILEFQDRYERLRNIVLVGIPETFEQNSTARRQYDSNESVKILKNIYENCPVPTKTLRLGKYSKDKSRPLKVCFESTEDVKYLLRNKAKLNKDYRLYADQTPSQKKFLDTVKQELERREQNGEKNLTIKYIKGIPKIINKSSKNENAQ